MQVSNPSPQGVKASPPEPVEGGASASSATAATASPEPVEGGASASSASASSATGTGSATAPPELVKGVASAGSATIDNALLQIEDLHTYYGHIHALKGIDLEVRQGEIVALIGANGAGKSTTLRTISGLVHPRQGRILFDGQDISRLPAFKVVERGISHAPEGRQIFATLTVTENLNMGAYTLGNDQAAIRTNRQYVFDLFPRLADRKNQLGGTLSGGEQQMLTIGRALMAKPRILLLDEPSLGLAPLLVRLIFDTLREINARGVTVLLVEQNARAALKLAHRAYVFETGRVALSGSAADLLQDARVRQTYLGEQ